MPRTKPKKGMALLLVMAVIVVVLTTVSIGATVLLNNLDASKGQEQASIAFVSAQSAIEKVRGYYKNDSEFFDGCLVNHCINFYENSCDSCDNSETMYNDGNRRYKVVIMSLNANGVSLEATGYKGLYNRVISDGIKFTNFICGDDYSGIITDSEGNEYPTTMINGQCWMAASLRTKEKPDGSCINGGTPGDCPPASSADDGQGRSCYNNEEAMCLKNNQGALYTWEAAMNDSTVEGTQGICPVGWRVPTDSDWFSLELNLTDPSESCESTRKAEDRNEFECNSAGLKLSPAAEGGTVGFEGIPTGYRDDNQQDFIEPKNLSKYWTSTGSKPTVLRTIDTDNLPAFGRDEIEKKHYSFALRCVKE